MKSEVQIPEQTDTLPALYRSRTDDSIVLFAEENCGTVISKGSKSYSEDLGYYSEEWIACSNTKQWERLPVGSFVILTQGEQA